MADRVKLWRRLCTQCQMLDTSYAAIADEADGEAALSDPWTCPSCGCTESLAARPMEDADLDELATAARGARPGKSLSRLTLHCVAEVAPNRACWRSLPPSSQTPLCDEHRDAPNVVISARLARYRRAVREWHDEDRRGKSDLPWA